MSFCGVTVTANKLANLSILVDHINLESITALFKIYLLPSPALLLQPAQYYATQHTCSRWPSRRRRWCVSTAPPAAAVAAAPPAPGTADARRRRGAILTAARCLLQEAIKYERGSLQLLDQKQLPHNFVYMMIVSSEQGWQAIKDMNVRGAPAIAISAVLSLAVECEARAAEWGALGPAEAVAALTEKLEYLKTSRPTAVNLFNECDSLIASLAALGAADGAAVLAAYIELAEKLMAKDIADNMAIGTHGAAAVLKDTGKPKVNMLTVCNTGSLATARYGTALGVIRKLHEDGTLTHAYCCETRPYNQGSRLTAFELVFEQIPSTLIVDSAAAALMQKGSVDAVVAGADRTCANGDTANKIGTYMLAILAKHHGVKFYIAAPFSTLDVNMASGKEITIEEREPTEVTDSLGQRVAAEGIGAPPTSRPPRNVYLRPWVLKRHVYARRRVESGV